MTPAKLLVIGLDAADLAVLDPLMDRGELPHLAGLLREGATGVLHSTVPPVSAPAWGTFMTGLEPGRHGLYAFVVEKRGAPMQLANLGDVHGPKLWDHVAAQGRRPVVVNVPVTWPAPEFDGVLVTGMLTPERPGTVFTHPPELSARIREAVPGYRIDVDRAELDDKEALYGALSTMTRKRCALFLHLMETQPWDLFVATFTNTDRVQHSFWRQDRAKVDAFFRQVDGHVGELLAAIDRADTAVMVMSDHGFQGARWKLYVNRFLADQGMLVTHKVPEDDAHYARRRPDWFDDFQGGSSRKQGPGLLKKALSRVGVAGETAIDWARTSAFLWSLDTGGVAVNLKSRYPHGTVADEDYEDVRDRVIAALSGLVLPDGVRAFRTVRRREDVYSGPYVDGAPDVVVEPDDCLDFGMNLDAKEAVRKHRDDEGHHSPRGLVSLSGPGFRPRTPIEGRIADCVPTILHALGLDVPGGLDGRVIEEAFADGRAVRFGAAVDASASRAVEAVYSEEEEEELRRSLEGLGYL